MAARAAAVPWPLIARPLPGVHGLVTAGHPLAAMAGLQVLMKGGNAVDAAVAVGSTLNMMEPQMNGVGGNGFMTIYEKSTGRVYSLAMAGAAPMAIKPAEMTKQTLENRHQSRDRTRKLRWLCDGSAALRDQKSGRGLRLRD